MLSRAKIFSGFARCSRPPRFAVRNMSEKSKDSAIKFQVGGKKETYTAVDVQAEANKFYNFFKTLKGQKIVGGLWVAGSVIGLLYQLAPHWFFLEQVKQIYQSYTNGLPTKVKDEMMDLIREVTVDMKLTEEELNCIDVFVLTMTEPFAWGDLSRLGLVGFPQFYYFQELEDVPLAKMRFGTVHDSGSNTALTQTQLESEAAKSFCTSMILSDDAKKFSIAREIERLKFQPFIVHGSMSFCFILLTYNVSRIINRKLELFKKPPMVRGIAYLSILPSMILAYVIGKDAFNRNIDTELDKRASMIGSNYAAGGVEYYEKVMQRNRALRELEGERGQQKYTGKGEFMDGVIRFRQANLHDRKEVCKAHCK